MSARGLITRARVTATLIGLSPILRATVHAGAGLKESDRLGGWCGLLLRLSTAAAMLLMVAPPQLDAQTTSKIRKPYLEEVVVENKAIVIALPQQGSRWRSPYDGQPGFYSWRVDAKAGPGLSVVLAADTMIRGQNLTQVVAGSWLRKCQDAHNRSARSCTIRLKDSVGVKDDFVLMILRDPATVAYFKESRPATVSVSTFNPHGRFRLERFRVRYRDMVMR